MLDPLKKYDKFGNEIDLKTWAQLFEDIEYRRIGLDEVGDFTVSTVWLGLDHNWSGGEPIIFETMVFDNTQKTKCAITGNEYSKDMEQERYGYFEDALAGHKRTIKKYENIMRLRTEKRKVENGE